MANTMTADTNRCSRLWFTLTANDEHPISLVGANTSGTTNEEIYCDWIKKIEERLADSFIDINTQ